MLSEQLIEQQPIEDYIDFPDESLFVGVRIKNLYDEKRLCISADYKPRRFKTLNPDTFLFGTLIETNKDIKSLIHKIKQQKKFDLIGYNLLLQDFKLTCNDCYFNLKPPLYPIDSYQVKRILPDFDYEKFICFNPEIPKFQAFTSLNLFLVVHD